MNNILQAFRKLLQLFPQKFFPIKFEEIPVKYYADSKEKSRVDTTTKEYIIHVASVTTEFPREPCYTPLL